MLKLDFDSMKLVYEGYSSLYNVIIYFAQDKSCLCHRQIHLSSSCGVISR